MIVMNKKSKNIVWFEEIDKHDVGLVGGKGANLGEMTNANFPIPYGFVVTSTAYFDFVKKEKLIPKIKEILSILNYESAHELHEASTHIQKLILSCEISKSLSHEIIDYYDNLLEKEGKYFHFQGSLIKSGVRKIKHLYKPPYVAVRSSATAEDLPDASFAGQQESYLNVKGDANLLQKVKECWASLFTERAIYYRNEKGFDHSKVGLATVVQRMIESDKSGVAFSIDPVTNDKTKIVIEAIFGLGEYIVQGKVTPDHYEIDKRSFVLLKRETATQKIKLVKSGISNKEVKLKKSEGSKEKLNKQEILKLAIQVKDIERHYYFPQDIEWAIEGKQVFIVQSRPITTIGKQGEEDKEKIRLKTRDEDKPFVTGAPASPGVAVGPAKVIFSPKEIHKIQKGDVLVARQTNPDYVPAMKKAVAIVTDKGGRTSHAAIVSRELGIPAVVGCENATKLIKTNNVISVNGKTGDIFKGKVYSNEKTKLKVEKKHRKLSTLTKVYVNLADFNQATKIASMDCDGIGLLRAEFIIAGIGIHPKVFIKKKKEKVFINQLKHNLLKFVKPFSPRPVIYRATDFKTNEYKHLVGGEKYEPKEENPMLGFRGASRYIVNPEVFNMELDAIKSIWDNGYQNLHLMIPFVRVPWEIIKIKEMVRKKGLLDLIGFRLLIMVEVPSSALYLEDFIKVGIDGVSIGTNDLTMMLLGVDRDNEAVANIYDERNPFITRVLEHIVKVSNDNNIPCSICGQAASDYPDIIEKLIKSGITSVSVNPDAIYRTRELIFNIEKKLNRK